MGNKTSTNDHLSYSKQCEYLIFGYLRTNFTKYKNSLIPTDIAQLCAMFHGNKLIDLINVNRNNVSCDNLRDKLFPNGVPSKLYYEQFDNNQRKELWKLMLITKYEKEKLISFKTLTEYKQQDTQNLPNSKNFTIVAVDTPRTTPTDISQQSVVSCLNKFYIFYPNAHIWSAMTSLIVPFLFVFNDEYESYLCYSSLVNHVYSMYYQGHDDKIKQRLLKIDNFWNAQNDHGRGNAREMLECQIGSYASSCLIREAFKLLEPELYRTLKEHGVSYDHKVSLLFLFGLLDWGRKSTPKVAIRFYDYCVLFGFGNSILWLIALLVRKKEEILRGGPFETMLELISGVDKEENWDFDVLCGLVEQMRRTLKKKNNVLLQEILSHPNDIDVVIQVLCKYYRRE